MSRLGSVLASLAIACSAFLMDACTKTTEVSTNRLIEQAQAATARGDLKDARLKLDQAIKLSEQAEDDLQTVRALNNLAEIEKKEDHIEKLRSLYERAATVCDRHVKVSDSNTDANWLKEAVATFSGLGQVYSNLGSFTTSESYFRKAIEFEERIDMPAENRKIRKQFEQLLKKTMQEKTDVDSATGPFVQRGKRRKEISRLVASYNKERTSRTTLENIKAFEPIYEKARQDLGVHDLLYGDVRSTLYCLYCESGNHANAGLILERDAAVYEKDEKCYLSERSMDQDTMHRVELLEKNLVQLTACYMTQKRFSDADKVIDRRIKLLERLKGPHWASLAEAYSQKSNVAAESRKIDDAIEYSLKAIPLYQRNAKSYKPNLRERYRVLADYYATVDNPKASADAAHKFFDYLDGPNMYTFEITAILHAADCMVRHKEFQKDAALLCQRAAQAALLLDVKVEEQQMLGTFRDSSVICIKADDCKAAESILTRALQPMKNASEKLYVVALYELLGDSSAHCKDWKNAYAYFKTAVQLHNKYYPKDVTFAGINNKLAGICMKLGLAEESIKRFRDSAKACKNAKEIDPYQSTNMQLAGHLLKLDRNTEARAACLEAAQKVQSDNLISIRYAMSGYCMAVIHSRLLHLNEQALSDYKKALNFYERNRKSLEKEDPTCEHLYWLAVVSKQVGHFKESLDFLKQYFDIKKSRPEDKMTAKCLAQLAFVSQKLGDASQAQQYKQKCEDMRQRLNLSADEVYDKPLEQQNATPPKSG